MEEPAEVQCMLWGLTALPSSSVECCTLKVKAVLSETSGNAVASEPSSVDVQYQIIQCDQKVSVRLTITVQTQCIRTIPTQLMS